MQVKIAIDVLGLHEETVKDCHFIINTFMSESKRAIRIRIQSLMIKIYSKDVMNAAKSNTKIIVREIELCYVLVGFTVLNLMGFVLEFLNEIASYKLGWQVGDCRQTILFVQFMQNEESLHVIFNMATNVEAT